MKLGLIYKITSGDNFIVGSTTVFNDRKIGYLSKLKRNVYPNSYLQSSYNKYGITFEVLQNNIPEEILTCVEDIWIGTLCGRVEDKKGGMNMRDASRVNHSEETKKRISESHKGKKLTQDVIDNLVLINSKECYQYDLLGNFIRRWNSITKAAIGVETETSNIARCCKDNKDGSLSISNDFMWFYEYKGDKTEPYSRNFYTIPIIQRDKKGNFIERWNSATEAEQTNNYRGNNISSVLKGNRKTAYGFQWNYEEQDIIKQVEPSKQCFKVVQKDMEGNTIKIWDSTTQPKEAGFLQSKVWKCCHGLATHHRGFKWEFLK